MHQSGLAIGVLFFLALGVLVACVYAFVHAALQRPDAYTATGKLTKPIWLAILGVSSVLCLVGVLAPTGSVLGTVIAAIAAGVYLADVRPKLLEIQGKRR